MQVGSNPILLQTEIWLFVQILLKVTPCPRHSQMMSTTPSRGLLADSLQPAAPLWRGQTFQQTTNNNAHTPTHTHAVAPTRTYKCVRATSSSSSLSSSSCIHSDNVPLAMCTHSRLHSDSSMFSTLAKPKLFMPQVTFQLLPVLKEGEGLEIK